MNLTGYYAEVLVQSPKVLACALDGDNLPHWIALSEMQPGTEVKKLGDRGLLVVSEWFARNAKLPPGKVERKLTQHG